MESSSRVLFKLTRGKIMLHTKILLLNTDSFIKTYPYNAFYLGILEANGFDISDILINEFFNLHCYYYKKDWHIDFVEAVLSKK